MKTLIAILAAAVVAFASAYVIVSNLQEAKLKKAREDWEKERAGMQTTPGQAAKPRTIVLNGQPTSVAKETPAQIIEALTQVKIGTGSERNRSLRQVVFGLEKLAACSVEAVPAIRQFLAGNVDIEYTTENDNQNQNQNNDNNPAQNGAPVAATTATATPAVAPATADVTTARGNGRGNGGGRFGNNGGGNGGGNGGNGGGFGGRGQRQQNLRMDWLVPPSLRIGLVGVLQEIGGPEAEQALVEMLNSTGRGVEVAYLARVLEAMAPGKYRDTAIAAAKELLTNPISISNPDRLDELSKSYLYGVLEFFGDASFTGEAQKMLIGQDGRIDRGAMDYLTTIMKGDAVAALYQAYQDQRMTNQPDRNALQREILTFAGQNPDANKLFQQLITDPNTQGRQRFFPIMQLVGGVGGGGPGGGGGFGGNEITDPAILQQRLALITSTEQMYAANLDEQTANILNIAKTVLQSRINGQEVDPQVWAQAFGRGGGAGAGGNNQNAQGGGRRGTGGGAGGFGRRGGNFQQ